MNDAEKLEIVRKRLGEALDELAELRLFKPFNPTLFAAMMARIEKTYPDDPEVAHDCADKLLCRALNAAGYGDGVRIFHAITKWYA